MKLAHSSTSPSVTVDGLPGAPPGGRDAVSIGFPPGRALPETKESRELANPKLYVSIIDAIFGFF